MAKLKRTKVGSFLKAKKEDAPPYLKFDKPVAPGQIVRVESKKYQKESLARLEKSGKVSGEMLSQMKERAEKIPDFVLGELVVLEDA